MDREFWEETQAGKNAASAGSSPIRFDPTLVERAYRHEQDDRRDPEASRARGLGQLPFAFREGVKLGLIDSSGAFHDAVESGVIDALKDFALTNPAAAAAPFGATPSVQQASYNAGAVTATAPVSPFGTRPSGGRFNGLVVPRTSAEPPAVVTPPSVPSGGPGAGTVTPPGAPSPFGNRPSGGRFNGLVVPPRVSVKQPTVPSGGPGTSDVTTQTTLDSLNGAQQEAFLNAVTRQEANRTGNNPGNMMYAPWMAAFGGTGQPGHIASFPTPAAGREALKDLLFGKSHRYHGMSIGDAFRLYAPRGHGNNDPELYARNVAAAVGKVPGGLPSSSGTQAAAVDDMAKLMDKQEIRDNVAIRQFLRTGGVGMDPHLAAWCAGFVNAALGHEGIKGTGTLWAPDFARWGHGVAPSEIQKGDVALYRSGHHVGLVSTGQIVWKNGVPGVDITAGNEFDTTIGAGPGRSQVGKVGHHWMPLNELLFRRTDQLPAAAIGASRAREGANAVEEDRLTRARRTIDKAIGAGAQPGARDLNVQGGVTIALHGMPEVKRTHVSTEGGLFKKVALNRGTNLPVASWDG